MIDLDLRELDRLEREAAADYEGWQDAHLSADPDEIPACTGCECVACEFMWQQYAPYAQLRLLLDLVERMGDALDAVWWWSNKGEVPPLISEQASKSLADYQRAKGEA